MEYILEIDTLVYGGYGLGRLPDGKALFVPFVLPGEKVRVAVREEKKRHAYGNLVEVLEAHPLRQTPTCKHFTICGGCHYQHIPYAEQLKIKETVFKEQLERMGGIASPNVSAIIPTANEWRYRNTVQFHLTNAGELAFMDMAGANPFKVEECYLPMEEITTIREELSFEPSSDIQRVEIRQDAEDNILIILNSTEQDIPEIEITLPISAVHTCQSDSVVLAGDGYLTHTLGEHTFRVSAGSFFQTNFEGAAALTRTVNKMVEGLGGTLIDLYCGVGLFSKTLSSQFDTIIGVEASEPACEDFMHNMQDIENVSIYQGPVEKVLPAVNLKGDCVIVDPPRKGMDRYALDALSALQTPVIIYVSCDPATLGRDVKRLAKSGYALKESVIVDMFPNTYHIESVNLLTLSSN